MKEKKFLAGIAALILCVLIPLYALGDINARNIEENGKIKEQGTHDELYALGGLYSTLISNG